MTFIPIPLDIILTVLPMLLILGSLGYYAVDYVITSERRAEQCEQQLLQAKRDVQILHMTVHQLRQQIQECEKQRQILFCTQEIHNGILSDHEKHFEQEKRKAWFAQLHQVQYRDENEISMRLIYPLLQLVGYSDSDIIGKHRFALQNNLNSVPNEIDWMICRPQTSQDATHLFLIKILPPGKGIAPDYAMHIRPTADKWQVAYYVVTDGYQFHIYKRNITVNDECLVAADIKQLNPKWDEIEAILAPSQYGTL
jgi:hypothetical protein